METLVSAEGAAPAAAVWRRYTRPGCWPEWAPQVRRVRVDAVVIRPGLRGTVHGPLFTVAGFRIHTVDHAARRWSWRVGLGAVALTMEHGVDDTGRGSRAWVRVRVPRPLVAPYVPLARWALTRLVSPTA